MRVWSWVRKEWGDHRSVLIGIAVAIPVLTAVAFWSFDNLMRAATPQAVGGIFAMGLMVLLWFGVASDLVATDLRRGTLSAVRRMPRGLGFAWIGKLAFLVLAVAALAGWTALCVDIAWSDNGIVGTPGTSADFWMTILMGAPLLSWPLLVGSWMGRSGAAGLGGLLVLGATGAPAWFWWHAHQYVFPANGYDVMRTLALWIGLAGFGLATLSFLLGHRHRGRAWRPFLVGGTALVVLLACGFAWGSYKTHRWTQLEPGDTDLRIWNAQLATGEKGLWVSVYRGVPWMGGQPLKVHKARGKKQAGTPLQTWFVDLESDAVTKIADGSECAVSLPGRYALVSYPTGYQSLDPTPAVTTYILDEDLGVTAVSWWDAASAKRVATLAPDLRNGATDALVIRWLRASTAHRDADGRRVWVRDGQFEREGQERPIAERTYQRALPFLLQPVPGGWFGVQGRGTHFLDVEGEESSVVTNRVPPWFRVLSREHFLDFGRGHPRNRAGYFVGSLLDPEARIEIADPPMHGGMVVAENGILGRRGDIDDTHLVLWNPVTGTEQPLTWVGPRPAPATHIRPAGRRSDGTLLVWLYRDRDRTLGRQLAVVDLDAKTIRAISNEVPGVARAIAFSADNSAVVLEGVLDTFVRYTKVVRYGPNPGDRTVLFPATN